MEEVLELVELVEKYNPQGVCIRRTINGYDLPADKEPSIVIIKNVSSITKKFFMTKKEAENRYGELFNKKD